MTDPARNLSDDEVKNLLRASARKRRSNPLITVVLIVLILVVPFAYILWYFWPGPQPPAMLIAAYDELDLAGQVVEVVARLEAKNSNEESPVTNLPVYLQEITLDPQPPDAWKQLVQTGVQGWAWAGYHLPDSEGVMRFAARYAPTDAERRAEDQARLFHWPADSKLLVIDVEKSLTSLGASEWKEKTLQEIDRNIPAAKALLAAGKKGYKPVYLACGFDTPMIYRKVRGWVQNPDAGEGVFPPGPVLGRVVRAESYDSTQAALQVRAEQLAKRFHKGSVGVTSRPEVARMLQKAGYQTFFIGKDMQFAEGVTLLPSWSDLAAKLP